MVNLPKDNIGRNQVSYGPHLFPGGPEDYIRTGNLIISGGEAHKNIRDTLVSAFNNGNPDSILSQISGRFDLDSDAPVRLAFMNYGDMQLVYLATIADRVKTAALVNQPHTSLGKVREEFDNLQRLVEIDSRFVVEPFAHFAMEERGHELYASQYVDNAMCIAVGISHGIYDPLPIYHFERFLPEISHKVNVSMVALIVNYYDADEGKGLARTQTSGNDFMLTRDFKKDDPGTVIQNMRIIAARDFIQEEFNDYLDRLEKEFLVGTYRDDPEVVSGQIRVNARSKIPMTAQQIEEGFELGFRLREERRVS